MSGPSNSEQLLLEYINFARANPLLIAASYGIGLNDNLPSGTIGSEAKPPITFSPELDYATSTHSQSMLDHSFIDYIDVDGSTTLDRITASGWYPASGAGLYTAGVMGFMDSSNSHRIGENLGTIQEHFEFLFNSAYRQAVLNTIYSEIGIGHITGLYTPSNSTTPIEASLLSIIFAEGGRDYITGVVINDTNFNQLYDIGEGIGNVTVTAYGTMGIYQTSTWDAGGYRLEVPSGSYTVRFTGGGLENMVTKQVTVSGQNVKLDVVNTVLPSAGNGASGPNISSGTSGADSMTISPRDDVLYGYGGVDTAHFDVSVDEVYINRLSNGATVSGEAVGENTLLGIERLVFTDGTLAIDTGVGENFGMAYRLYQAAFARTPDERGLLYWVDKIDHGWSLDDTARNFVTSAEFAGIYGNNPSNHDFVARLYQNVLGRDGEAAGIAYWVSELNAGNRDMGSVLAGFSESDENVTTIAQTIGLGYWYS